MEEFPQRIRTIYYMQTRPLSLGSITWNTFLHHLGDRKKLLEKNLLAEYHIPMKFIKRVNLNVNMFT